MLRRNLQGRPREETDWKTYLFRKKVLKLLKKWTGAVVRTLIAVFLPRISVNDGHLAEEKYAAAAPQAAPTLAIKLAKS